MSSRSWLSQRTLELTCLVYKDGLTLMHWVAQAGSIETIQTLNHKIHKLNTRDAASMTPLHDACRCGKRGAARLLLELGADPSIKDSYGRTPSIVAWQYGHTKLSELCENNRAAEKEFANTSPPVWSLATLGRLDPIRAMSNIVLLEAKEPRTQRTVLHCLPLKTKEDVENETFHNQILEELLTSRKKFLNEIDAYGQNNAAFRCYIW